MTFNKTCTDLALYLLYGELHFNSASQLEVILSLGIFGNVCGHLSSHTGGEDALHNEEFV